MSHLDIFPHVQRFMAFSDAYLEGEDLVRRHISLKQKHTLYVLEAATSILEREGLDQDIAGPAQLAALYHDAGRFPQFRDHQTFRDSVAGNHALLGVRTIKEQGFLDQLPPGQRRLVLAAVAVHNRLALPGGLSPELAAISHVVRDADKIDIMRIMREHFTGDEDGDGVVVLSTRDDPERYSDVVYRKAMQGRVPRYSDMVWSNDFKITIMSWVHDLHYDASRQLVLEQGQLAALAGTLPPTEAIRDLTERCFQALDTERFA